MKILVTGANGLLGQHLIQLLIQEKEKIIAVGKGPCRIPKNFAIDLDYFDSDIGDLEKMKQIFQSKKPESIIHAAAMTQVDDCEQNKEECFRVNVLATRSMIHLAEQFSKFFLYVSTDFVFDGKRGFYNEEDVPNPVNWYGHTKLESEKDVMQMKVPWAIVRTCLVFGHPFGSFRNNLVTWVNSKLEKKEKIKVVDDQFRTPTDAHDLASGIFQIIKKKSQGIFHISGKDKMSPYEMAIRTAEYCGLDKSLIERVDETSFSQPAIRPKRTGFNIEKARKELGYEPVSFDESLMRTFSS
jgi:dTDP-4-dehydrorhamnose reductase